RAGVGHLRIVDRDFLELHNLQRQVLFDENDVNEGLPKAEVRLRPSVISTSEPRKLKRRCSPSLMTSSPQRS
ncbi:MAG: ThiF family adenylyltransferase, partial [Deltaproteobacteria bacterium]|nr:ThiF family adenylyltransferase [Deltaproteobacteria bacterium]